MFKIKFLFVALIFSTFLIGTSSLKNKTRELEKKINFLSKKNIQKIRDYKEIELDFHYLNSPQKVEQKIFHIEVNDYIPMEYSNIYLSLKSFLDLQYKHVKQEHK
tara:strand:- start:5870 stop:6184 length:315 start_codon:yes stop_codon:yes gene_type:complete